MTYYFKHLSLVIISAIFGLSVTTGGQSFSQSNNNFEYVPMERNSNNVYFKSGAIIPQEIKNLEGNIVHSPNNQTSKGGIYILQFSELPNQNEINSLSKAGVELIDYIPNRAYIALIQNNVTYSKLRSLKVSGISEYQSNYKLDQFINKDNIPDYADNGSSIRIIAHSYPFIAETEFLNSIKSTESANILNLDKTNLSAEIDIDRSEVTLLAQNANIKFLEIGHEEGEPENYDGRTLHRSNTINNEFSNGLEYDGSGVVMMMQDDADIGPHIDWNGRIDQSLANSTTGSSGNHGDHVAGIFMGAGNLDPLARGMAPGAFGYIYGNNNSNYALYVPGHVTNDDLTITVKSYSNGCNAGYTSLTQTLDQQVVTYPSLIHVFSAGNAGTSNCGYGAGSGWGNVTGGHKIGKNVIAVANVNYIDNLAGSSSRGPASDGRIKPDLSAKGSNVYSNDEDYDYRTISGTSMACPGVAGIMAQLYHAYKDHNAGQNPNSALMKAIALNTADDIGNPGPDFKHGWGRINALNAYKVISGQTYLDSTIGNGGSNTHTIIVPPGVTNARFMLYWKDPAASPSSTFALVNDLDLKVFDPSLSQHLPYVLNPAPNATTLDLPATNGIDDLNNVEQVEFNSPNAGTYTIEVTGSTVPQGPQEYFIVYYLESDFLTLTYPIGGEPFVPGETETIRWDAVNNSTFTLEYSIDSGANWTMINNNISGNQRYFNWTVPSNVTGDAMIRVSQGPIVSQSQRTFSIIDVPENLDVLWSCQDSLYFTWDPVTGADSYEISMLGTTYMDSIGISATNNFVVKNISTSNEQWLSVKALNQSNQIIGRRAYAYRKTPGQFNCPIPNDIGISRITNPESGLLPTCQSLDSIVLTVMVTNFGSTPESNFPIFIELNNGSTLNTTFSGTLQPYSSQEIVIPGSADLSGSNFHSFKSWTGLNGDSQNLNDTAVSQVSIYNSIPVSIPYFQSFDLFNACGTNTNCAATNCNLTQGWINYSNNAEDEIDWRTNSGGTTSNNTGPSSDHTGGGNYLYLEASGNPVCSDKTAIMVSPCFNLSSAHSPELSFWYHMYGAAMGELHLDVLADGQWYNDVMIPITGNQGNSWQEVIMDLSVFAGKTINLRFRGITGSDFTSDLAIDDINIIETFNAAQAGFTYSQPNCAGQSITFTDNSSGTNISYNWIFGMDAVPSTATGAGPHNVVFNERGFESVKLVVSNSAGSDSISQNILIDTLASINFAWTGSEDTISFINQTSNANTYSWDFGDGNTSSDLQPVHVYSSPGIYTVTLTVTNGCGTNQLSQDVNVGMVGISDIENVNLRLYPNPNQGILNIQSEGINQNAKVEIYDLRGIKLYSQIHNFNQNLFVLDINDLSSGMYILKINTESINLISKFEKE